MHSALIELVARPQTERPSRWMIKLASRTQGVVVRAASEFGDLTLSGPAWERAEVSVSIQRFGSLLAHLPSATTTSLHTEYPVKCVPLPSPVRSTVQLHAPASR